MNKSALAILFVLFLFAQCTSDPTEECAFQPETANIKVEIAFQSLEDSILQFHSKKQLVDFFSRHTAMRDVFFNRSAYPDDSVFINELYRRFTNPAFDTLLMETKRVFGDGSGLKKEFTQAFTNLKYYYPEIQIPKIETVITGMESDLFVSDSLVIVGLDYFLGHGAKYQPNMYEYMLRRYTKEFVVPSTMLLYGIDGRINTVNPQDKTVLADMIAYGKAYYFAKQMLPCVPDSVFIGYTSKEINGARENTDIIWKHLVEREVFFNTAKNIKQKYIDERPTTIEIGDQCPGRIGVWIGWQIVTEFAKKNAQSASLPKLMKLSNPEQILKSSKFRPG
ncbi:MAG: gliding motility lipoprotein GldB [Bacteroidetes bacterium]|nr:gliding motility lipoprotein GldB [Bacteroidota bacterium]